MRSRHRLFALLLATAVAAAGCTSSPSTDPTSSPPDSSAAVGTGAASSAGTATSVGGAPAVPTLSWGRCPPAAAGAASTDEFECATAVVPMDYTEPSGDTFSLALIKAPAKDQANRIGTLFWNPGGPSDAGTQYLPASIQGFPEQVQQTFDIVSWDPRGMGGGTTPVVQCFDSAAAEEAFVAANSGTAAIAVSPEELAVFSAGRTAFNEACIERNGELLAHVSTADNARDLDLLRQAVGDEQMNYYGTSYGTFMGATYLNMFPDKVRSAVLDGAVFPTAWAEAEGDLSTFLRVGSDLGSAATVTEFMNQCGAVDPAGCAFSAGSPEATQAKWAELLERAKAGITLEGQSIDDRAILSYVQSSIYIVDPIPGFDRFPGWPAVGEFLQAAWTAAEPGATAASAAPSADPAPSTAPAGSDPATASSPPAASSLAPPSSSAGSTDYTTSAGRQLAVICGESPNPMTDPAIAAQAQLSYARAGVSAWPFIAFCNGWTTQANDPYLGPWNNPTAPVLVIGNTFDPATPYASSQRMAEELADGHFLTVNGFGHTELLNPSQCAKDVVASYLIDGTVPTGGTECAQDKAPFAQG